MRGFVAFTVAILLMSCCLARAETCAEFPLTVPRPTIWNGPLEAAVNLILNPDPRRPISTKDTDEALAQLSVIQRDAAARQGAQSVTVGLSLLDRWLILQRAARPDPSVGLAAIEILQRNLEDPKSLETLFWVVSTDRQSFLEVQRRFALESNVLAVHRRKRGDLLVQARLWNAVLRSAEQIAPGMLETLHIERVRLAEQLGSEPLRIAANGAWADYLSKKPGRLEEALRIARKVWPPILAGLEAAVEQRKRKPIFESYQSPFDLASCSVIPVADVIAKSPDTKEAARARRWSALRVALTGEPGTDIAGTLLEFMPILSLRAFDRSSFEEAAEIYGLSGGCKEPTAKPAVCGHLNFAKVLQEVAAPDAALLHYRDATALIDPKKDAPADVFRVYAPAADAEWRFGLTSRASELLKALQSITPPDEWFAYNAAGVQAFALRAELAEAMLDDVTAAAALKALATRAVGIPIDARGKGGAQPNVSALAEQADRLVALHLRRRFCVACDIAATNAAIAFERDKISRVLAREFDGGRGNIAVESYLNLRFQPPNLVSAQEISLIEQKIFQALSRPRPYYPRQTPTQIKSELALNDDRTVLNVMIILSMTEADLLLDINIYKDFYKFMREREPKSKSLLWKNFYNRIADENYSNFGAELDLYNRLDTLARIFQQLGYPVATAAVLSDLIDRLSNVRVTNQAQARADEDRKTHMATLLISARARLAALYATNDPEGARRQLNEVQKLVTERMAREWRNGDERTIALVRELRPALRLSAQTWLALAIDPKSARPTDTDNAVEALQVAGFGDTAISQFASERRRSLANPRISKAVADLDEAIGAQSVANVYALHLFDQPEAHERLSAEATLRVERARSALEVVSPKVAGDLHKIVAASRLKANLGERDGFVVLHAASDQVWGILLKRNAPTQIWRTPIKIDELAARLADLRQGLDLTGEFLPPFSLVKSAAMFDLLLGPAAAQISALDRLFILSDGPIQSVPFAVLVNSRPEFEPSTPSEFRGARISWFGHSHSLVLVTSAATFLAASDAPKRRVRSAFLGVGAPSLNGKPGSIRAVDKASAFGQAGLADPVLLRTLPALPETADEVRSFARNFETADLLLDKQATEARLKAMPLDRYAVLLFATHGLVAGTNNLVAEPGLVLSPPNVATADDDGLLTAGEIASLKLDADLVILSACNSGSSDGRPRAEAFTGLARAFVTAGARNLLVTHWSIPSKPTTILMSRAAASMRRGEARGWSDALRRSMKQLAENEGPSEYAHPAVWGAFALIGRDIDP